MNPNDETFLKKLCGGSIPQDVADEVNIRTRMLHRCGGGIALGPIGLIDACRKFDIGAPAEPAKSDTVDWRAVKPDGSVEIEANFGDSNQDLWLRGVFLGTIGGGLYSVRLHGHRMVRERRASQLRIYDQASDVQEVATVALGEIQAATHVDPDPVPARLRDPAPSVQKSAPVKPKAAPEPAPDTSEDEGVDGPDEESSVDWDAYLGGRVWVETDDDDILDGLVSSLRRDGDALFITVNVDGEDREFRGNQVRPA